MQVGVLQSGLGGLAHGAWHRAVFLHSPVCSFFLHAVIDFEKSTNPQGLYSGVIARCTSKSGELPSALMGSMHSRAFDNRSCLYLPVHQGPSSEQDEFHAAQANLNLQILWPCACVLVVCVKVFRLSQWFCFRSHARPREHADRKRKRGNGGVERNVQADAVSGEKEPEWYISILATTCKAL